MAHVHGAAGAAEMSKHIANAGAAEAMERSMEGMMMKHMMGEGMGGMMSPGMRMAKGAAATGAVVSASSSAGRSFLGRLLTHPLVLLGIGVAVGYSIHKYRKDIISAANRAAEKSKDFVLQQRENLEDIVAESRESKD